MNIYEAQTPDERRAAAVALCREAIVESRFPNQQGLPTMVVAERTVPPVPEPAFIARIRAYVKSGPSGLYGANNCWIADADDVLREFDKLPKNAQPEAAQRLGAEPLAWFIVDRNGGKFSRNDQDSAERLAASMDLEYPDDAPHVVTPVYTRTASAPVTRPVAWIHKDGEFLVKAGPLGNPGPGEWFPLTYAPDVQR